MLQTGLLATTLTVSRYITKATQTNIQFLHAVGAVAHATPSRTHADYHNALISLSKWGPFHLFCHSCNVAISLIYPIYLAFQTLSCLAQQSARGWGPPQQLYLWPSPALCAAAFHCGLRNGPLTPECAHTEACRRGRGGEAAGTDVQRL